MTVNCHVMDSPEFSFGQICLFCVCAFQFPLHVVVLIFDVPREVIFFDTEVVVNTSVSTNTDSHYIEHVQNLRLDVPLSFMVVMFSCGVVVYGILCASVYQSGCIKDHSDCEGDMRDALFAWNITFWCLVLDVHFYVLSCILNPVEFHFFAVVALMMPLSVYRMTNLLVVSGGRGYETPDGVKLVRAVYMSLDFVTFVVVFLAVVSAVRNVFRMALLLLLVLCDILILVGHCYDGDAVNAVTVFNCRFFVMSLFSVVSLVVVRWWEYVMFDVGLVVRAL